MFACCDWLFARCWPTFERGFCNQNFDSSIQNDAIQCTFMQTNATIHATQTTCAATQTTKCNNNDQTTRTKLKFMKQRACATTNKAIQCKPTKATTTNKAACACAMQHCYFLTSAQFPQSRRDLAARGKRDEPRGPPPHSWQIGVAQNEHATVSAA
jgi:hypothetical protein